MAVVSCSWLHAARRLALPLLALTALSACGPVYRAQPQPVLPWAAPTAQRASLPASHAPMAAARLPAAC